MLLRRRVFLAAMAACAASGAGASRSSSGVAVRRATATATEAGRVRVASGTLRDAGPFHRAAGSVALWRSPTGKYAVELVIEHLTPGPDLHVCLASDETASRAQEATLLYLGRLKAPLGEQAYDVPPNASIAVFRGLLIRSRLLAVNFATARLA